MVFPLALIPILAAAASSMSKGSEGGAAAPSVGAQFTPVGGGQTQNNQIPFSMRQRQMQPPTPLPMAGTGGMPSMPKTWLGRARTFGGM